MCSTSSLPSSLTAMIGGQAAPGAPKPVSASMAKIALDKYILINVLEADEKPVNPVEIPGLVKVPLGKLLGAAFGNELEKESWFSPDKTLLMLCNVGMRAEVAAAQCAKMGYKTAYVTRGMLEWAKPAATKPDFCIVLASDNTEHVSLALSAANTSQSQGLQTVLCSMSDGVLPFVKAGTAGRTEETTVMGMKASDPFKPTAGMFKAFQEAGGLTFACTTCAASRQIKQEDFLEGVIMFSMPDLIRMQQESNGSMHMG